MRSHRVPLILLSVAVAYLLVGQPRTSLALISGAQDFCAGAGMAFVVCAAALGSRHLRALALWLAAASLMAALHLGLVAGLLFPSLPLAPFFLGAGLAAFSTFAAAWDGPPRGLPRGSS